MTKYYYEFGGAIALYMLILAVSLLLLSQHQDAPLALRVLITLAPMIPAGLLCWAIVRQLHRLDEMHLRIQFEVLGFAFAAAALLTFSYGLLENVGAPHLPWLWVWPVMGATWIIGLMIAKRRYQ